MLTPSTEQQLLREVAQLKARLEKVEPALPPPPEPKRRHALRLFTSANDKFHNANNLQLEVDCPVFANMLIYGPKLDGPSNEFGPAPTQDEFGQLNGLGNHTFARSRNPTYNNLQIKCSCGLTMHASKEGVTLIYELEEPKQKQKQKKLK